MSQITYRSIRDQVTDLLRHEILAGKLAEGEPIREIPLAKRFNVSRGPIRDAILQLTQEGLLTFEANKGAKVGQVWDNETRPLMVNMRFGLESFAIKRIIHLAADAKLEAISRNLRLFELACRDGDLSLVVQLDLEFHRLILRESGIPGIEAVWLPIMGGMRLPYSRHREFVEIYNEHKAILDAILIRDPEKAVSCLRTNIN